MHDDNDQRATARIASELSYLRSLECAPAALGDEEGLPTAIRESQRRLVELVRAKHPRSATGTPASVVDVHPDAHELERRPPRWLSTAGKIAVLCLLLAASVVFWVMIAPGLGVGNGP